LNHGFREQYAFHQGRDPSPDFHTEYYTQRYLKGSAENPLIHYLAHKDGEGIETKMPQHEVARFRSPVFILGAPRSGTTILANALRKAGYFGYDEGHLLSALTPIRRAIAHHYVDYGGEESGQLLFRLTREDLLENISLLFKRLQSQLNYKEPWLDKTPDVDMIRAVPMLSRLWP